MARNRCDGLLARVDFPLYTLQTLTNRHVIVAGGGGASNTGVANGFVRIHLFVLIELVLQKSSLVYVSVVKFEARPINFKLI